VGRIAAAQHVNLLLTAQCIAEVIHERENTGFFGQFPAEAGELHATPVAKE
jgi:hypothetical protein